ncbi:glutamate racemase [Pelagerythrobacter rhizovicinus]|uniref:Glutamate racemase n=1 Tax=Pelagerythrobacter rhizovicinus TaxID=2268576 RepID=A0A4Q2KRF3_9SPHN|nr:glutamate racemase [Pelagerythrobacter rhizovicinus]RXZ65911.1 glutamate racemase [Pelagerythrobacter rhizovicinus]
MDVSSHSPILLFDSGVGGLSVLAEVRKTLPHAPVIYAADLAGLPYGTKSEAEVAARVCGLLGRMAERWHPRLICIACNTASTIALGMVREVLEIPIVGTVPAIKPAAVQTRSGTIGLLGTAATIRQAYVDNLQSQFGNGHRLLRHAAPGLVEAAEAKLRGRPLDPAAIRDAVAGLREQPGGDRIDTVVLACTHFPLLRSELEAAFGPGVALIDGAEGIARRIAHLVAGQPMERREPDRAVTTGPIEEFQPLAEAFRACCIERLEKF